MKVIGITGNIAVGKTTICKELKKLAIPVFNSDDYVKKLYKKRGFIKKIGKYFPEAVSRKYFLYHLNIEILKKYIIKNFDSNLDKLEKLIHPQVKKKIKFLIFYYFILRKKFFIIETAILFESNLNCLCNYIVYVKCCKNVQKQRFLQRQDNTEDLFVKFDKRQNKILNQKLNKSDIVIDTTNLNKNNLKDIIRKILI